MNGEPEDTLMLGGVALHAGLQPGPLEPMVGIHFYPLVLGDWSDGVIGTICVDTAAYVSPCGGMVFVDLTGNAYPPLVGDLLCLPVKLLCGNPNGDNDVNVGDVVFMINHIFRDGPEPNPWQLGDANLDGNLDVGDVVYLIAAAFRIGPQPECPDVSPNVKGSDPEDHVPDSHYLMDILCDSLYFPDPGE
jgi:hypothetical protein